MTIMRQEVCFLEVTRVSSSTAESLGMAPPERTRLFKDGKKGNDQRRMKMIANFIYLFRTHSGARSMRRRRRRRRRCVEGAGFMSKTSGRGSFPSFRVNDDCLSCSSPLTGSCSGKRTFRSISDLATRGSERADYESRVWTLRHYPGRQLPFEDATC